MAQQAGGNGWSQAANSWDGWWDAAWDVNQWWSPGNWRWREQDARGAGGWEEEPRQPEATGHQGNAAWAQGTPQPTQQPLPQPMPQAAVAVPPAAAAAGPPAVPPAVAAAEPPHGPQQRPPQAQQPTADWLAPKQPAPTPPPAPAPAATRQPAVAGAPPAAAEAPPAAADGPTVFDLEFFLNREVTTHWKYHNAALKYFRFAHEGNIGEDEEVVFNNARPERVAKILHEAVGPGYGFDIELTDWWWQDMIAQLDAWSMAFVVNGPDGRSGGVLGCSFSQRPRSYDHKRNSQRPGQPKLLVFDFVVERADGTRVRLHPNWSSNKVEAFHLEPHRSEVQPPRAGPGRSDGKGTFKHYKTLDVLETLKFAPFHRR